MKALRLTLYNNNKNLLAKTLAEKAFHLVQNAEYQKVNHDTLRFANQLKEILKKDPSLHEEILFEMRKINELYMQNILNKYMHE